MNAGKNNARAGGESLQCRAVKLPPPCSDDLNRLDAITADGGGSSGTTLASHAYLGLGTVVPEDDISGG